MRADWSLSAADAAALRSIALAAERATLLGRYVGPYDRAMVPFPPVCVPVFVMPSVEAHIHP